MESTEPDASGPMALWEFARHIRTTTVTDTTNVRLVVPTDLTERGASALTGLRPSRGCGRPQAILGATTQRERLAETEARRIRRLSPRGCPTWRMLTPI